MNIYTLRPVYGLVLLLVAFSCIPGTARTQGISRKRAAGGLTRTSCVEATVAIVGAADFGLTNIISGTVRFKKEAGGTSVTIGVDGLKTAEEDPFHIHVSPVGRNNCGAAGKHFNPTNIEQLCPGRVADHKQCQVGDLSGKGEKLKAKGGGIRAVVSYVDQVIDISQIVGRSVVVHDALGVKIACGDIACKRQV
ncbi:hypothetical protein Pst134EA_007097 [Puccinia striiformis f. sp. tritici]|uniref:hypothetical protein n=1 Tax=Puccinia striiformis f. sp. tritici TaxID=168172 RepID=UPI002007A151|nr:hypothetical protein Pst134EA_007097 [Puccinia striiformis f. sp. tritici]KAH9469820.1 hypothetical protein Pst134EA_007097 [Puccinia striiformis f. sp. tritici]